MSMGLGLRGEVVRIVRKSLDSGARGRAHGRGAGTGPLAVRSRRAHDTAPGGHRNDFLAAGRRRDRTESQSTKAGQEPRPFVLSVPFSFPLF